MIKVVALPSIEQIYAAAWLVSFAIRLWTIFESEIPMSHMPPETTGDGTRKAKRATHADVISSYHTLLKQLAAVDSNPTFPTTASKLLRKSVLRAQISAIGIDQYQVASRTGEAVNGGVDCSAWIQAQIANACASAHSRPQPLSLLDVGAIVQRFHSTVLGAHGLSLHVKSIDLNPQDSSGQVEKIDFFDFAVQAAEQELTYDVVVLSLVLNFVPLASNRGKMLSLAHSITSPSGLLFIVLPRACVANSRYCDEELISRILKCAGWSVTKTAHTSKLARFMCMKVDPCPGKQETFTARQTVRGGSGRNNFLILMPCAGQSTSHPRRKNASQGSPGKVLNAGVCKYPKHRLRKKGTPRTIESPPPSSSNQRRRARQRAKHERPKH
jgi:25S rRNA (adenine2142-N1)-methyltransferase